MTLTESIDLAIQIMIQHNIDFDWDVIDMIKNDIEKSIAV